MKSFLTKEEIQIKAPSVFTIGSHEKLSKSYAPISTYSVLEGLFDLGYGVTKVMESKSRMPDKIGYTRHMVRLRERKSVAVGDNVPEIVLINSHDGSSSYQMRAGVYRLVCANGMVVGTDQFSHRVRHQGDVTNKILEIGNEIIEIFPEVIDKAQTWSKIELDPVQKNVFASSAFRLMWDTDSDTSITCEEIINPRRSQDMKNDLWTTFNIIQENMIRGGMKSKSIKTGHQRKTRPINSPSLNSKLNIALWNLTQEMASLVV